MNGLIPTEQKTPIEIALGFDRDESIVQYNDSWGTPRESCFLFTQSTHYPYYAIDYIFNRRVLLWVMKEAAAVVELVLTFLGATLYGLL